MNIGIAERTPIGAGDVAGGRDDAALAAADDHRLVAQGRIVALLDGGEEGVAIDMGDGERVALGVAQQARGAAVRGSAGAPAPASRSQAVAAEQPAARRLGMRVVSVAVARAPERVCARP